MRKYLKSSPILEGWYCSCRVDGVIVDTTDNSLYMCEAKQQIFSHNDCVWERMEANEPDKSIKC
jgi:hypothetical protein